MEELEEKYFKDDCKDFLSQARKILNRYKEDWKFALDEYTKGLNNRTIMTEYQVQSEVSDVKLAARMCGHRYDEFLTVLNSKGKMILREGADDTFIEEMYHIIEDTFDAIGELEVSFTTSGAEYRDLGTYEYEIPKELEDIRDWWKNEYNNIPYIKENKKKEQEASDSIISSLSKNLEKEQQTYNNETEEINKELEDAKTKIEEEFASLQKEQLEKLTNDKESIINELQKKVDTLKEQNNEKEKELSSLGILQFIQKDKLKTEININNQNIVKYNEQINNANTDFQKEYEMIKKEKEEEYNKKLEALSEEFKYPTSPEMIIKKISNILSSPETFIENQMSETKTQKENKEIMDLIYQELTYIAKPVTIPELMELSTELSVYSNSKLSVLLKQMSESNRVIKVIENKKSYFTVNDTQDTKENEKELIDKNRMNSYSNDRKKVYSLLKNKGTINPNEFILENITSLRAYQILFSLVEDNIASIKIEDGIIKFILTK